MTIMNLNLHSYVIWYYVILNSSYQRGIDSIGNYLFPLFVSSDICVFYCTLSVVTPYSAKFEFLPSRTSKYIIFFSFCSCVSAVLTVPYYIVLFYFLYNSYLFLFKVAFLLKKFFLYHVLYLRSAY